MTSTDTPAQQPAAPGMGRAWLLAAADRLDREGQHELAAEARAEAATTRQAPQGARHVPCQDCQRPVSLAKMPQDWPYDWWSHAMAGGPCGAYLGR